MTCTIIAPTPTDRAVLTLYNWNLTHAYNDLPHRATDLTSHLATHQPLPPHLHQLHAALNYLPHPRIPYDTATRLDRIALALDHHAAQTRRNHLLNTYANATPAYLRYGQWSTHSWNHRDNHPEPGISVYPALIHNTHALINLTGIEPLTALHYAHTNTPLYHLTGTLHPTPGTDGEPLLTHATGTPITLTHIDYLFR